MRAKVKNVTLPEDRRIIAISDIHGNLEYFERLLEKVGFCDKDILVIVGDFLEKGKESLQTLRYLMELSQQENVYIIIGNCDDLHLAIRGVGFDNWLLEYDRRKYSLMKDMCAELEISFDESDIAGLKTRLNAHYVCEFDWLASLPTILNTQNFIFVHGGLTSSDLEEQVYYSCVKNDGFMNKGLCFDKYVIVGHWPTVLYGKKVQSCNPVVNSRQKIISIDGGNIIKGFGQLNAFIIPNMNSTEFVFEFFDDLPVCSICEDQAANLDMINIVWGNNKIEILQRSEAFSYCRHIPSDYQLWIPNDYIYQKEDGFYYCNDITDYRLPVSRGDIVSVVDVRRDCFLAKKDGVVGWIGELPGHIT